MHVLWRLSCVGFTLVVFGASSRAQPLDFTADRVTHADGSTATLSPAETPHGPGSELSFELPENGWASVAAPLGDADDKLPVSFLFKVSKPCTLELKFLKPDGSTFGQRVPVEPVEPWQRITMYPHEAEYWWGNSRQHGGFESFNIAVSGTQGTGKLTIVDTKFGKTGTPSTFGPPQVSTDQPALLHAPYHGPLLDPDRNLPGFGVRQRRAKELAPEDPLVLEWLKVMQDTGTPDGKLLPSTPGGDEVHTFNNVLAAMAFIRHGERERAERILDYFRDAAANAR